MSLDRFPLAHDPEKWQPAFGRDHTPILSARGSMTVERPGKVEQVARDVIEQAAAALSKRRADIPAMFIAQLYGRAVPEDVVRYGVDDLAALAERAYDFIAERTPGAPKIRCETVPLAASGDR